MASKKNAKPPRHPSFREALGMSRKRLGSFARDMSKPVKKEPLPEDIEKELTEEIRLIEARNPRHKRLPTKKMARALLRELKGHPYKPTAMQVAQALVRSRGTHRDKLLPWMNAALSLQRRLSLKGIDIINGKLEALNQLVRKNILHDIRRELTRKDGPHTSLELAEKTGNNHRLVINALNLLEAAGMAERVSIEGSRRSKQAYRWMAAERSHRAPIPTQSMGYKLWSVLGTEPKNISELAKAAGIQTEHVDRYLDRFVTAGLVEARKRGRAVTYSLTKSGRRLSTNQRKSRYFLPELRRVIMMGSGEKGNRRTGSKSVLAGLTRRRIERYRKTALCMRIRAEYKELARNEKGLVKRGQVKKLARKYGLTKNQVWQMVDHLPTGNMTVHRMWAEVLPAMREIDPQGAILFERFLLENEGNLKESAVERLRRAAERERKKAVRRVAMRERAETSLRERREELAAERGRFAGRLRATMEQPESAAVRKERAGVLRKLKELDEQMVEIDEKIAKLRGRGPLEGPVRRKRAPLSKEERLKLIRRRHRRLLEEREGIYETDELPGDRSELDIIEKFRRRSERGY